MATHKPTMMIYSHRSNHRHAHSTRHGVRFRAHWFAVYKCPACGRHASHKRQPIICRGN